VDRRLLVANQDMLHFVLIEDGVVDVEYCAAGITEHMFDILFGQAAYKYFRAGKFVAHSWVPFKVHWKLIGCSVLTKSNLAAGLGLPFFVRSRQSVAHP